MQKSRGRQPETFMLFDSREAPHIYYCRRCDSNEQGAAIHKFPASTSCTDQITKTTTATGHWLFRSFWGWFNDKRDTLIALTLRDCQIDIESTSSSWAASVKSLSFCLCPYQSFEPLPPWSSRVCLSQSHFSVMSVSLSVNPVLQSRKSKCRKVEGDSPRLLCFLTLEKHGTFITVDIVILMNREQLYCMRSNSEPASAVNWTRTDCSERVWRSSRGHAPDDRYTTTSNSYENNGTFSKRFKGIADLKV